MAYGMAGPSGFGKLGAGGGSSGGGASSLWKGLGSSLTDGLMGGVRSGISKRVDAQLAGDKGIYGTPAGALQIADSRDQAALTDAMATQQAESQGQYLTWQAEQAAQGRAFQADENAKDRALTLAIYGGNGAPENGQRTPMDVLEELAVSTHNRAFSSFTKDAATPTLDIGRVGNRHYGSNW